MRGANGHGAGRTVLIIGIYYSPEITGNAPYSAGLAEHLAERGDDVTVLAGLPHYPAWRISRSSSRALFRQETLRGVTVMRAAHYVPHTQSAMRRMFYEGTFGLTGFIATLRLRRPDVILGIVPNLSSGVLARVTSKRLRVPYGLLFQNLVGPTARQSGIAGGAMVATATAATEAWAARRASAIGVATETFTPYLVSLGVPKCSIVHVPNWTRLAPPALTVAETRARFGWADAQQVVLHAGNIGLMQGLEQIVDLARMALRRSEPVHFVISGDGSQSSTIRSLAHDLTNVSFLGVQSDGIHASLLAAADVLLLSERSTQVDTSLPSKLTSYFAAGRPIIAAVPPGGGSAREVARSGAGLVVPAGELEQLLTALARLRAEPALVAELARAGPAYADANTSAAACLTRATVLIDAIAA